MSHRKDCGCSVCRPASAVQELVGQVDPHGLPAPADTLGQELDRITAHPADRLIACEHAIDGIVGTVQAITRKNLELHSRTDELRDRAIATDGRTADLDAALTELRGIVRELSRTVQELVKPAPAAPGDIPPAL